LVCYRPGRPSSGQGVGGPEEQDLAAVGQHDEGHYVARRRTVEDVGQQERRMGGTGVPDRVGPVFGDGHT